MLTFPWNYNATYHVAVLNGELKFNKIRFLKRINEHNEWQQVPSVEYFADIRYSSPYYAGNGLIIYYYEN